MSGRATQTTRSQLLGAVGLAQVAMGASYFYPSPMSGGARDRGFAWVEWLEPQHLGVIMVVSGLLALLAITMRLLKSRRADLWERIGFSAVLVPYVVLAVVFLLSWIIGGNPTGWISAISYSAYSVLTYLAAGVTDPPLDSGSIRLPPRARYDAPERADDDL